MAHVDDLASCIDKTTTSQMDTCWSSVEYALSRIKKQGSSDDAVRIEVSPPFYLADMTIITYRR
jgi:hypothetical protein